MHDNVDTLAEVVNTDEDATLNDQLDVIDAQSSADAAVNSQASADSFSDQGDWESQQAQEWSHYAEGAAEQGLGDLAENAANTAASYSGDASESYDSADAASTDVDTHLDDTATSVSEIDPTSYTDASVAESYDTSVDTSVDSSVDTSVDSSYDAGSDGSEY